MATDRKTAQALLDDLYHEIELERVCCDIRSDSAREDRAYSLGGRDTAARLLEQLAGLALDYGLRFPPPERHLKLVVDNTGDEE